MISVELMREELEMATRVIAKWQKHLDGGFLGPEDPNMPTYGSDLLLQQYCAELFYVSSSLEKLAEITSQAQINEAGY